MNATCAIGVDVGGTAVKTVVASRDGVRLLADEHPTPAGPEALVASVARTVSALRERVAAGEVTGPDGVLLTPNGLATTVGVDVPGIVDEGTGTGILSVNLGWRDLPLRSLLETALGCPVTLGHDVRSGAWAEARWGAAAPHATTGGDDGAGQTGSDDARTAGTDVSGAAPGCLYLALGTGVAAGILLDGRLVSSHGWAGEVGQVLVEDPDRPGTRRPLEQVASAAALARRWAATRPREEREAVVAGGALGVQRALEAGDAEARRVWDTGLDALADLVARTVCTLGPLDVVVGGGLVRAGEELLLAPLRERVAALLVVSPAPRVVPARLGPWAQALGSAGRALEAEAAS